MKGDPKLSRKLGLKKTKGGHFWPPLLRVVPREAVLDALDVFCLPALRAFDHVKLDLLTFLQAAESAGLNGGEMHEDILAVLAADESIALGVVKPLHCSGFHDVAISFFVDVALKLSGFFGRQVTRWVERR